MSCPYWAQVPQRPPGARCMGGDRQLCTPARFQAAVTCLVICLLGALGTLPKRRELQEADFMVCGQVMPSLWCV